MAFLSDLGNIINQQFSYGENTNTSLDGNQEGSYGLLGKFASKFDHTADRTYIEDGLIANSRPRLREVLFQEPSLTIVVKKKMFSSLIENYRADLMEEKERLFIRASKKLFQNKCKIIAAYERLTKVEKFTKDEGEFNTALAPMVLSDIEEMEKAGLNMFDAETRASLSVLRRALAFSSSSQYTTWVNDYDSAFVSVLGEGTGAIELTTVTNINTLVSTKFSEGNASFSIEDPYRILVITQKDIDQAIADTQNFFKTSPFGLIAENELTSNTERLKNKLNATRLSRGVSGISFIINPQSIISKKVRAIKETEGKEIQFEYNPGIVGLGGGVTINESETTGSYSDLTSEEASWFTEIISNIYTLIGMTNTTQTKVKEFNQEMNFVRNRMRLFFKGKSIIQNLDVVNVFMSTKTSMDTNLTAGFPGFQTTGQLNTGQLISNLLRNINGSMSDISGSKTSPDEYEKAAIVGPNFPTWLWRMFKNNITKAEAGTAVWVGLVKHVSQSFDANSGRHTINVQCEDNASYFNKSQVNIKPSLNVFNSTLYDPLTPFDLSFDAATGEPTTDIRNGVIPPLLAENQRILNTRALKFRSTDFRGQNANQILYKTKKGEIVFGKLRRVLADSEGFVYRWKQGIQSITKVENLDNSQNDSSPAITVNPFAGQDVMNVLSLLITGQPYNFNTFIKGAISNANDVLAFDPAGNEDAHSSYIDGIVRELSKRNVIWGNFIPFKSLSVNDEAFAFISRGQADLTKKQSRLQSLIRQRAAKSDQRAIQISGFDQEDLPSVSELIKSIDAEISLLDEKIETESNLFTEEAISLNGSESLNLIGNDVSMDPGFNEFDGSNAVTEEQRSLSRAEMRRKVNALALRRLWKVKANNDPNLFIVDDQYDKNYDIQAFERKIGPKLELFNSEYLTVDSQIKSVADILGLEVFADSQGNIIVRPPLYNRMPSSVFYKMFKDRAESGVKVFPDFLETLLFNQVNSITSRLEIVEDEIRFRAIAIGITGSDEQSTDWAIRDFIRGGNSPSAYGSARFNFITDPSTGKIPGEMLQTISLQADPSKREEIENSNIKSLEELNLRAAKQVNVARAFDVLTRVKAVQAKTYLPDRVDTYSKTSNIRTRLLKKGVTVPTEDHLFNDSNYKSLGNKTQVGALNVINSIANFVAERQKLIKLLANTTKNLQEGLQINKDDSGAKAALFPFLNRKTSIPSMLEHMIEDESFDDIGVGSGNRFVIKESQVMKLDISENAPPYTAVQVNGLFAQGIADVPSALAANIGGASGGNTTVSAYAVDYDLWYQYGFIAPNSVPAPWAADPVAQCAPFAVSLLNQARRKVFSGSVTINGYNEYYQVGDVVYLESLDLLFYVEKVAHSFSYEGSLSTQLTLTYGHNPGEYIPTHLDMIGKFLYNAQTYSEQYRSSRFAVVGSDISIGTIVVDNINPDLQSTLTGPNGKLNKSTLDKILYSATGAVNPNYLSNTKPTIQLRIYTEDDLEAELISAANEIKQYLINPTSFSTISEKVIGDSKIQNNMKLNASDIEILQVDIDNDTQSPSAGAWHAVRIIESAGINGSSNLNSEAFLPPISLGKKDISKLTGDASVLDDILMRNIIDVWVTFKPVKSSMEKSNQNSQSAQETNTKVSAAEKAGRK